MVRILLKRCPAQKERESRSPLPHLLRSKTRMLVVYCAMDEWVVTIDTEEVVTDSVLGDKGAFIVNWSSGPMIALCQARRIGSRVGRS